MRGAVSSSIQRASSDANGVACVVLCVTGMILFPEYQDKVFRYSQPALFGELAIMLWLLRRHPTGVATVNSRSTA
jgi:hypothetical protein